MRENGFYWVMAGDQEIIAEWNGKEWFLTGIDFGVTDKALDGIDEKRIVKEESE